MGLPLSIHRLRLLLRPFRLLGYVMFDKALQEDAEAAITELLLSVHKVCRVGSRCF